jgi:hypothetical protein
MPQISGSKAFRGFVKVPEDNPAESGISVSFHAELMAAAVITHHFGLYGADDTRHPTY